MSTFERYLTLWVAACIIAGIELGQLSAATPGVVVAEILMGTLVYRVVSRQEITAEFAAELVGVVFGDAAV